MRAHRRPRRLLRAAAASVAALAALVLWASPAAAELEQWADRREGAEQGLSQDAARCAAWLQSQDWDAWIDNGCEETRASAAVANGATDAWLSVGGGARTTPGWSISRYALYYDGGGWKDFWRKQLGAATAGVWMAAIIGLRLAVWAMDWVAAGRITEIIGAIPIEVGELLHKEIVVGLQLRHLALTVMGVVSAWAIMRQRIAEAVGNMAFAVVALALGAFLLANLAGYYDGARATKALLVAAVLGTDSDTIDAAEMTAPLMDSIVHNSWENLNFGRPLSGDCEINAGVDILERAPSSGDHYPRLRIKDCPDGASLDVFNRYPTPERFFGTLVVAVGQAAVALMILSTALIGLTAELLLAAAFASFPVVAVIVAFPGGRSVAASWVSMLLRGIVGLAAGVFGLRLAVLVMSAVAANSTALALFERFVVFSLVAIAAFKMRKLVPQAAAKISATLGGKAAAAGTSNRSGAGASMAAGLAGGIAGGAAGGLAGGAVASQLMPAQGAGAAVRAARRAATGTRRVARGATGLAAVAAQASGSEGAGTRLLSHTKAGRNAAYSGGIAAAAATAAGTAIGRRDSIANSAGTAPALNEQALHELAHGPSRRGQIIAARHPNTSQTDVDHLASSLDTKVVKAAAPRASAETTHKLGAHPKRSVRAAAATAENLSARSAQQLVTRGRTSGPYQPPTPPATSAAASQTTPKPATPPAQPTPAPPSPPRPEPTPTPPTQPRPGPTPAPPTAPPSPPRPEPTPTPPTQPRPGPTPAPPTAPPSPPRPEPTPTPPTQPRPAPTSAPPTAPPSPPRPEPTPTPPTAPAPEPTPTPPTAPAPEPTPTPPPRPAATPAPQPRPAPTPPPAPEPTPAPQPTPPTAPAPEQQRPAPGAAPTEGEARQ